MALIEKNDLKPVLKKHVNTIHCSNNLTLVQRKLFNAFLFNAYHDLPDRGQYEISIKKLCNLIGYDSRDYKKLKKSIMDLITTAIEWNVIEQEGGQEQEKWRASAIISSAKIEKGLCTYEFSSIMRELLHRPEIYGKVDINIMVNFKSGYGLALYENCIRFQSIASTPWLPIKVFRKLMGISDDCYQSFSDFKKRVLDIALREVNQFSPIKAIPEIQRSNKKVTNIRFKLSMKQDCLIEHKSDTQSENNDLSLTSILKLEFAFSDESIADTLSKYEYGYIKEKVELIKQSSSFKSGKIRELAAYLVDALRRDYKASKSSRAFISNKQHKDDLLIKQKAAKEEEKRWFDSEQKKKRIDDYIGNLGEKGKENLMAQFEEYLKTQDEFYFLKAYKKSGLENKSTKALFNTFMYDFVFKGKI